MPTYQYECSGCGHEFEILQSMTESKLRKCPHCGKFKLNRLIGTGGGIIFKGSGFYATDYKKQQSKPSETKPQECSVKTKTAGGCACHEAAKVKST